ncbi:MAG: hypothetical protein AVDCRST_MAG88-182, partial [uncultured Thermomicrobiales bacterium]
GRSDDRAGAARRHDEGARTVGDRPGPRWRYPPLRPRHDDRARARRRPRSARGGRRLERDPPRRDRGAPGAVRPRPDPDRPPRGQLFPAPDCPHGCDRHRPPLGRGGAGGGLSGAVARPAAGDGGVVRHAGATRGRTAGARRPLAPGRAIRCPARRVDDHRHPHHPRPAGRGGRRGAHNGHPHPRRPARAWPARLDRRRRRGALPGARVATGRPRFAV